MLKIIVAEVKLILEREGPDEQTHRIENEKEGDQSATFFVFLCVYCRLIVLYP